MTAMFILRQVLLFFVVFACWCAAGVSAKSFVHPGHSAYWYDPERSGEGLVLEVLDQSRANLYWFTYDEQGEQRWLNGVGNIERDGQGERIVFPDLLVTHGGRFGPDFDPDDVVRTVVGEAILHFSDCDLGHFSYQVFGQAQELTVSRLSRTMGADCGGPIHGRPGEPVKHYAGQSGSWYDRTHSGEGYALQWMARDEVVLSWYSYDGQGNQFWMIGVGSLNEGRLVFPELHATRGARFGDQFDPGDVERFVWGSLELELGCDSGMTEYDSPLPGFGSGSLNLSRLTALAKPGCPYDPPRLSELYDFEIAEVPIGDEDGATFTRATGIAADGTVVARREENGQGRVLRWRPGDTEMEQLPGTGFSEINWWNNLLIAPDGSFIATNREVRAGNETRVEPSLFMEETGWKPMAGLAFAISRVVGSSQSGSHLAGAGWEQNQLFPVPWISSPDQVQQRLELSGGFQNVAPEDVGGWANGASDDGRVAIGVQMEFLNVAGGWPHATRWSDGEPELLEDHCGSVLGQAFGCSAECTVIVGGGQGGDPAGIDPDHPHMMQAWYWTESQGAIYLGAPPDAPEDQQFSSAEGVSADGSLIVGTYPFLNSDGSTGQRAFIWTQATGIESIPELLAELEVADDDWDEMQATVSPDGRLILLSGTRLEPEGAGRAIGLRLNPRPMPFE